jgi:hypothetical protein
VPGVLIASHVVAMHSALIPEHWIRRDEHFGGFASLLGWAFLEPNVTEVEVGNQTSRRKHR